MAKKRASKTAPKRASKQATAATDTERGKPRSKVYIPELAAMLEQLKGELDDIEKNGGLSPKTVTALLRINDLLPLLRFCQESMTRP